MIKITYKNNLKKLFNQKMSTYHNYQNNMVLRFNITKNSIDKLMKRANNKVPELFNQKVNLK